MHWIPPEKRDHWNVAGTREARYIDLLAPKVTPSRGPAHPDGRIVL